MSESKYSKYIQQSRKFDSRDAALPPGVDPESVTNTASHRKILSLDDYRAAGLHVHRGGVDVAGRRGCVPRDCRALLPCARARRAARASSAPTSRDPYDLGGEIEFWIEDEKFMLDQDVAHLHPEGHASLPVRGAQGRPAHLPLLVRAERRLQAGRRGRDDRAGAAIVEISDADGIGNLDVGVRRRERARVGPADPGAPMSRPVTDLRKVMDVTGSQRDRHRRQRRHRGRHRRGVRPARRERGHSRRRPRGSEG